MLTFDFNYCTAHYLTQDKTSVVHSCSSTRVNKDISFEKNWQDSFFTQ